jgi:hypothetical protein
MGVQLGVMIQTGTLNVTQEILRLIAEIDEFKGAWRALGTLAPERLSALRRVATIESIGSSTRIEGSKLTDRQVEALLANLEIKSFATRDEQEVAGYAETMELIFRSWQEITLTENHIKQLHRDLLSHSEKDEHHRGEYKTQPNNVVAWNDAGEQVGIVFETAAPFNTPRLMAEIVDWTREALDTREIHPLLAIAVFVVVFLEIHPFQDGNGRLSRILTTLLLLRSGYLYVQLSGERDRAQQRGLLPCSEADPGNHQNGCAELAALGELLSPCSAAASEKACREGGEGEDRPGGCAGALASDRRVCAPTWPGDHWRNGGANGSQQKHAESAPSPIDGEGVPYHPRWRPWSMVRAAVACSEQVNTEVCRTSGFCGRACRHFPECP